MLCGTHLIAKVIVLIMVFFCPFPPIAHTTFLEPLIYQIHPLAPKETLSCIVNQHREPSFFEYMTRAGKSNSVKLIWILALPLTSLWPWSVLSLVPLRLQHGCHNSRHHALRSKVYIQKKQRSFPLCTLLKVKNHLPEASRLTHPHIPWAQM